MAKLLIVADDFTGALDTGVQFAKQGIRTLVTMLSPTEFLQVQNQADQFEVLVVDTQSRHAHAKEAFERVFRWVRLAKELRFSYFYKKTDSVMRGNIGAELSAALLSSGRGTLFFIPAYPQIGRTVKNGKLFVNAMPVTQTRFSQDPFTPVRKDDIAELLSDSARHKTISTDATLYPTLTQMQKEGTIVIFDSETESDLEQISTLLHAEASASVFAGCAGFANYLPNMIPFRKNTLPVKTKAHSFLFVTGSLNDVTERQVSFAENQGISSIAMDPAWLLNDDICDTSAFKDFLMNTIEKFKEAGRLIVRTTRSEKERAEILRLAQEIQLPADTLHLKIAANFGKMLASFYGNINPDVLTVFGGDTLHSILSQLHCTSIEPLSEILPGIAESRISTAKGDATLVSKSGGFGSDDAIIKIIEYFR